MADNSKSSGTKELPSFSSIKPYEHRAIILRANGRDNPTVTKQINEEFGLAYEVTAVAGWFYTNGKLEQAYMEYCEMLAQQSIRDAKLKIRRDSKRAADTLSDLMGEKFDSTTRLGAAKATLAKYIPDKQINLDGGKADDDIPDEIADAGDLIAGESDDPQPAHDAPESGEADKGAGE